MDENRILEELIAILEKQAIPVKQDRGNFKGGLVRYHEEQIFYLNRKTETAAKVTLIIEELKHVDLDNEQLSEELRTYLEERGFFSEKDSIKAT